MKLTRLLLAIGAVLFFSTSVFAQVSTRSLSGTACPGVGCADLLVANKGSVGIQVTGTFSGTLQFEQTIDGTTWGTWPVLPNGSTTAVTSATAAGLWFGTVTVQSVRVRFSTYTSGTAVVSLVSIQAKTGSGTGSGSGTPGGANTQLQFNNSGVFAGTGKLTYTGDNLLTSVGVGVWLRNQPTENTSGAFEFNIGVASNDLPPGDTRPNHVANLGWNGSGAVTGNAPNGTGIGASTLVFESYCSFGTGCLAGNGGQSETYFNMNDGKGSTVRPLGFFQQKFQDDVSHYLSVIARSDTWSFFDAPQNNLLFSIIAAHGAQDAQVNLNGLFVGMSPDGLHGDWLFQDGQSLIRSDTVGVAVGPNSSLKLGATGEVFVTVPGNHFGIAGGDIEGIAGTPRLRLGAASATNFPKLGGSGTDDIILEPAGSSTNIQMTIQSKGSSGVYLNPSGPLRINGGTGVTASGSSCVITAITKGIITGATCTP